MAATLDEDEKKKLVDLMVNGKLLDILDAYRAHQEARVLKIPRTGDTALHVAINSEKLGYYRYEMVRVSRSDTLAISNEHGDTPLHLAAILGDASLTKRIAEKGAHLVGICNGFGETPLFSAVSRGNTEAFLCLHHICKDNGHLEYGSYARKDGDTILHSAIFEEHFDLAYIIISEYPDLVHQGNKEGFSPLHLLATKPSVFPSGLQLFGIQQLVYQCVCVRELAKTPDLAKAPNPQQGRLDNLTSVQRLSCFSNFSIRDCCWEMELGDVPIRLISLPFILVWFLLTCAFYLLWIPFQLAKHSSGYTRVKNIKKRCIWSVEVMKKLIPDNSKCAEEQGRESPILVAAKHGILEIVSRILDVNPGAILDVNTEKKNTVMLAVEHRHTRLYEYLITNWNFKKIIFVEVDKDENSVLHIAANLKAGQQFWRIQGAALHMQMEIKWYKFIKKSMPPRFFARLNKNNKTSKEIFKETHQHLIDEGRLWLTNTSQSCSVVAALIATVAFATSATVPGGLQQDNGVPSLEHKPVFIVSATSSLVALSSSMISVVMFLGILTSNFKLKDFRKDLPYKLLLGLISLLISIISMFISFFAGHYFVLKQEFDQYATPVYLLLCFPLIVYIIAKFPLSFDIVRTTLHTVPRN